MKVAKEFFLHVDIAVGILLLIIGFGMLIPDLLLPGTWVLIVLGMFLYACSEYLIHRFLFHLKSPKNQILLRFLKRLHYDHHEDPNEISLLFLPLWYTIPNFSVLALFLYLITGSWRSTLAIMIGVVGFMLYYEWVHFVAHRPITPATQWGKWMKKYHLWHHYKNEHYWYGVTNPGLDIMLGTYADEKSVEMSRTARKLDQSV